MTPVRHDQARTSPKQGSESGPKLSESGSGYSATPQPSNDDTDERVPFRTLLYRATAQQWKMVRDGRRRAAEDARQFELWVRSDFQSDGDPGRVGWFTGGSTIGLDPEEES